MGLVPHLYVLSYLHLSAASILSIKLPATITASDKELQLSDGKNSARIICKQVFEALNGKFATEIGINAAQPFPGVTFTFVSREQSTPSKKVNLQVNAADDAAAGGGVPWFVWLLIAAGVL